MIKKELLEILCCPKCNGDLEYVCSGINHMTWYVDLKFKGKKVEKDQLIHAIKKHPVYSKQEKVRIDILERLFIKIIENTTNNKTKLNSDMINLIGCSNENFLKLLTRMNYKYEKKENTVYFKYISNKSKKIFKKFKTKNINNPFEILSEVNFK